MGGHSAGVQQLHRLRTKRLLEEAPLHALQLCARWCMRMLVLCQLADEVRSRLADVTASVVAQLVDVFLLLTPYSLLLTSDFVTS